MALRPAVFADGVIALQAIRSTGEQTQAIDIIAHGPDPGGIERELARASVTFQNADHTATADLSLPAELRNRITRFSLDGVRSAGAVSLTDDALKRRKVALISGRDDREGLELLSATHYLEQALEPAADLIDGALGDVIIANPDVIILADGARLTRSPNGSRTADYCCVSLDRDWRPVMLAGLVKTC